MFRNNYLLLLGCCLLLPAGLIAQQQKAARYPAPNTRLLTKDPSLQRYYRIDSTGVYIYSSPQARAVNKPECVVYPDEYARMRKLFAWLPLDSMVTLYRQKGTRRLHEVLPRPPRHSAYPFTYGKDPKLPLKGLRVAIDPGHVAGDFVTAQTEGKYILMKASPATRMQEVRFFEANLTLVTAHLVREALEAQGATVFMTRTRPGRGASGLTFEEWKSRRWPAILQDEVRAGRLTAAEAARWETGASDAEIFTKYFNPRDLRERARLINAFQPHLTLIIHYNVDEPSWRKSQNGYLTPIAANYAMAFVPGSFTQGELSDLESRVCLLRMILTEDIRLSVGAADAFIRLSTQYTGVPAVAEPNPLPYLNESCLYSGKPGVYARNLNLTRMVSGPLIYGESLCQENEKEWPRLNTPDITVAGIRTSSRLRDVSQAYAGAVVSFAKQLK